MPAFPNIFLAFFLSVTLGNLLILCEKGTTWVGPSCSFTSDKYKKKCKCVGGLTPQILESICKFCDCDFQGKILECIESNWYMSLSK